MEECPLLSHSTSLSSLPCRWLQAGPHRPLCAYKHQTGPVQHVAAALRSCTAATRPARPQFTTAASADETPAAAAAAPPAGTGSAFPAGGSSWAGRRLHWRVLSPVLHTSACAVPVIPVSSVLCYPPCPLPSVFIWGFVF